MLATLAEAAIRTLLLACLVQSCLWLFRVRHARLLLACWTIVLAASLAMPAFQRAVPLRLVAIPTLQQADFIALPTSWGQAAPSGLEQEPQSEEDKLPASSPLLEVLYLLVAGALLLRLGVGIALSLRLLARARPAPLPWNAAARIRISADITAPVTIAGVILLPADAGGWSLAMRRAVIAHEGAHVSRWDFVMLLASQLNRAVFWFSPLPWWLHRRLARLAELASDDHALDVVGDRIAYAEILLEMGRRSSSLLRGVEMARPATLPSRIDRLLSGRLRAEPVGRMQWTVLVMGAVGLWVAAANTEPAASSSNFAVLEAPEDSAAFAAIDPPRSPPAIAPRPEPMGQKQRTDIAAASPPSFVPLASPPAPSVRAIPARTRLRQMSRETLPRPPVWQAERPPAERSGPTASAYASAGSYLAGGQIARASWSNGAGQRGQAQAVERAGHSLPTEQRLPRSTDQRTCSGAYLPGPIGYHAGGWLNMVRATFFRKTDGTRWLTLYFGTQSPVTVPVKVTGSELEFVGVTDTAFKIVPQGANHLSGTTQHPYGTIDLSCSGPNARLFDEES